MARDAGNWLVNLGQRVISSTDSEQEKLNKTLAIFASGLMGFVARKSASSRWISWIDSTTSPKKLILTARSSS